MPLLPWLPTGKTRLFPRNPSPSVPESVTSRSGPPREVFRELKGRGEELPSLDRDVLAFLAPLSPRKGGLKIRIHGNYQLGKVLFTGKDFSSPVSRGNRSGPWAKGA